MDPVQDRPPALRPQPTAAAGSAVDAASLESQLPGLRLRLLRHARCALRDDGLAEDLVQNTLMLVVAQHGKRRSESSLPTCAIAIRKHKVADGYRPPTRKRMACSGADDGQGDEAIVALCHVTDGAHVEPVPAWQRPDNRTEQRQMTTVLERCVSCLPRRPAMNTANPLAPSLPRQGRPSGAAA